MHDLKKGGRSIAENVLHRRNLYPLGFNGTLGFFVIRVTGSALAPNCNKQPERYGKCMDALHGCVFKMCCFWWLDVGVVTKNLIV